MTWTLIAILAGALAVVVQELRRHTLAARVEVLEAAREAALDQLELARSDVTRLEGVIASRDRLLDEALDACSHSDDPRSALARVRLALDPTGQSRARLQADRSAPGPSSDDL